MTTAQFELIATGARYDAHAAWWLVLSAKDTSPPRPRVYRVDIEGRDGSIDLSEWTGDTRFQDRTLKLTFGILRPAARQEAATQAAKNALLGRRVRVTLSDDPGWYYEGRCEGVSVTGQRQQVQLVVDVVCGPYKLASALTSVSLGVTGEHLITLHNARMPVVPTVELSAPMTLTIAGSAYNLGAGTYKLGALLLREGETNITATGTGSITITYREGAL